jgi:uncharacterized protein YndB with AHSA1/START domain
MTSTSRPTTSTMRSQLSLEDGEGVIRIEDVYDTDIDDLWSALTDPDRLARWFATVEGDLRVRGQFQACFTSSREAPGRIDVCQAPDRLMVTIEPGSPDETVMEAVLTPEGEQTRLVIEERGLRLEDVAEHGAGWQTHLEDLATHLAGGERGDWHARWIELTPSYRVLAQDLQ